MAKLNVDDIFVTYVQTNEAIPTSECGAGQKAFLASYYASLNK